jgi:hypothetical protein
MNKSQRIREYAAANPFATAKEIGVALDVKPAYVYAVLWALKQKAKPKKAKPKKTNWKTLHVSTSNNSIEKAMEDTVTNTSVQRMVEMAYKAGRRVHPVTGKSLMQGAAQIEMFEPEHDPVNHPAHYKVGGIETIDFIEAKKLNYNMGNAVKYITRADHKGNRLQDLEKAIWYLKRELGI